MRRHRPEHVANNPRKEGTAPCKGGEEPSAKPTMNFKKNEKKPALTRSTDGGEELPIPEASSSVSPNADGEVDMGGPRKSSPSSTEIWTMGTTRVRRPRKSSS